MASTKATGPGYPNHVMMMAQEPVACLAALGQRVPEVWYARGVVQGTPSEGFKTIGEAKAHLLRLADQLHPDGFQTSLKTEADRDARLNEAFGSIVYYQQPKGRILNRKPSPGIYPMSVDPSSVVGAGQRRGQKLLDLAFSPEIIRPGDLTKGFTPGWMPGPASALYGEDDSKP